jgi:LacI family transcriptional regulator
MSLKALATQLGLSISTVSRALSDHPDVSEDTKARVRDMAARIDYVPNALARRLQKGRCDAIALVLPGGPEQFNDPFFLDLISGVGSRLAELGLDFVLRSAVPGPHEVATYRDLIDGKRCDGIIVPRRRAQDPRIAYLTERGFPFVGFSPPAPGEAYPYIQVDNRNSGALPARHLLDLGHQNILLLVFRDQYQSASEREAGFLEVMATANVKGNVVQRVQSEDDGFQVVRELLSQPSPPTGLLCATDRMAIGALRALFRLGLRCPENISLIGYGNQSFTAYTNPPLTTVHYPIDQIGRRAVDLVCRAINGESPTNLRELWNVELVVRGSTGPSPR